MTATSAPARRGVSGPAGDGEVPRTRRRRWLPFSPWHFVLIPATVLLLFPFAWLLITSVETPAEALHFPPVLDPHVIRWANCSSGSLSTARSSPWSPC
jgi:multiple sugar transport system permease protein